MITRRIASSFTSGVRSRGQTYYSKGRVTIDHADLAGTVAARVSGGSTYDVDLELTRGPADWTLSVACTCPYGSDYGDRCKHVWATLLALDGKGYFKQFGAPPGNLKVVSADGVIRSLAPEVDRALSSGDMEATVPLRELFRSFLGGQSAGLPGALSLPRIVPAAPPPAPKPQPDKFAWLKQLSAHVGGSYSRSSARQPLAGPIDPLYVLEGTETEREGRLVISLAHRPVTPTGKIGKLKKLAIAAEDVPTIRDPADRLICLTLVGAGTPDSGYGYYGRYSYQNRVSSWTIPVEAQKELLGLIADRGRFLFRPQRQSEPAPLSVDAGGVWELALRIEPAADRKQYRIYGRLRRGEEWSDIRSTDYFMRGEPALMVRGGVLSRVEAHDCFGWIDSLRRTAPQTLRKEDLPKLLKVLGEMDAFPPIEWPPEWNVQVISDLRPQPELALNFEQSKKYWNGRVVAMVSFHYDGFAVEAGDRTTHIVDARNCRVIRRQFEAERACLARLGSLGVKRDSYREGRVEVPEKRIGNVVITLVGEGWRVLGDKHLYRRPGEFSINVSTGIDWFEVRGGVDFGGQLVAFPQLLEALRKNEQFVQLGDGSLGMLPEQWLAQHSRWLEMGQATDGHVRFTKTQIGLIDALLAEMPQATFDENLAAARQKIRSFRGVASRPEPAGFVGELRPYQREGLGWLHFLNEFDWGGCLADDMGLGKTVQVLALLADRKQGGVSGPSLVIAPKSLVFNWAREAERFTPQLRVLDYTGLERKAQREEMARCDVVLTTYGTLRRDVEFLRGQEFEYVILDEAQAVKNPDSQSAKAVRLLKGRRRLVMTGTPIENHLGDLWSQFEFLNPGMLGSLKGFRGAVGVGRGVNADSATLTLVQRMLRPFILRRTKEQVAPELPGRVEQTLTCEMGKQQTAYYNELRDHYRASVLSTVDKLGLAKSKMHVLEALLRLRQAACHPGLIDVSKKEEESAKLEALMPMLAELVEGGHKALVFSQFVSLLAIVREALDKQALTYEYLDGQTTHRDKCVDRFQNDPKCPLFLISLKAGGVGLNLTAADYVFILDPWWNPAVEAQAIDRTHRIGQDKKVIAYRLIAKDTVEAKILELQKSKRDLAEAIITEHNSLIRTLTREDLAVLLS